MYLYNFSLGNYVRKYTDKYVHYFSHSLLKLIVLIYFINILSFIKQMMFEKKHTKC